MKRTKKVISDLKLIWDRRDLLLMRLIGVLIFFPLALIGAFEIDLANYLINWFTKK